MKSDFKKYFFILLSSSLFFFLLILNQDLRNSVIYFDWLYLDGLLSRNLIEKEPSINVTKESNLIFNYDWLINEGPIFIAHRGGDYLETGQNTKTTIQNSIDSGLRFIEIDFYIDKEGKLSCLTDKKFSFDACSIEWVFSKILEKKIYVVIDLKLDVHNEELFAYFYSSLKNINGFDKVKDKLIPQSYNLININTLLGLGYNLGPIFTSYRTNVPLTLILSKLEEFQLKAMAIPYQSVDFIMGAGETDISFFLFPIKNLDQLEVSLGSKVKGIYSPFEEFKDSFLEHSDAKQGNDNFITKSVMKLPNL